MVRNSRDDMGTGWTVATLLLLSVAIVGGAVGGCRSGAHASGYSAGYPASSGTALVTTHENGAAPAVVADAAPRLEEPPIQDAVPAIQDEGRESFATPEEAIQALATVAETRDKARAEAIFGTGSLEILESGDEAADRADAARVVGMVREHVSFEDREGRKFPVIGSEKWRFAIPLARGGKGWVFDLEAGREELLNRRIGRNEILTVGVLEEIVEAQREYAAESRPGKARCFAPRIKSRTGARDGLYWEDDEMASPLGPLVAAAERDPVDAPEAPETRAETRAEGADASSGGAVPFNGYYFKILHGQGKAAPGGERSYTDGNGDLTGGCGALAWPARYGNSGVMTFIVNQAGIVYEKDLGAETERLVREIRAFDPDESWKPSEP
jgi:hypothetical protein